MSIEYALTLYSNVLSKYEILDHNPFEQEKKLSFYDYVTFRRIIARMFLDQQRKALKILYDNDTISSIMINGPLSKREIEDKEEFFEHKSIFDDLEDDRDCSFCSTFHITRTLSIDNQIEMMNMTSGLYLTPNLLRHFDMNTLVDYDMLKLRVDYYAFMIGFRFDSMDYTGNKA